MTTIDLFRYFCFSLYFCLFVKHSNIFVFLMNENSLILFEDMEMYGNLYGNSF